MTILGFFQRRSEYTDVYQPKTVAEKVGVVANLGIFAWQANPVKHLGQGSSVVIVRDLLERQTFDAFLQGRNLARFVRKKAFKPLYLLFQSIFALRDVSRGRVHPDVFLVLDVKVSDRILSQNVVAAVAIFPVVVQQQREDSLHLCRLVDLVGRQPLAFEVIRLVAYAF